MAAHSSDQSHFLVFWRARKGAYAEAAKEFATVSLISALPFMIGAFAFLLNGDTGRDYIPSLESYGASVFLRGQLLLISVSFISTSLYRLFNSDQSYRRPDAIAIFAILLFGVIGTFYGRNPQFEQMKSSFAERMSVLFFVISLVFYYYTAVLAFERPKSIEQVLQSSAKGLKERLGARRARATNSGDEDAPQ